MSVEKIIEQINLDSNGEVEKILNDAKKQASNIIKDAVNKANIDAKEILTNGKKQSESIKKILVSKANQNYKRKIIKTRETIIEECFEKAKRKLIKLGDQEYKNLIDKLILDGIKKLGERCTIKASRDIDIKIAKKLGIKVTDKIDSTGGIILKSKNGKITLDNTFEGIINREKERIRIKVGKLLFS
jgi:V/A-type H+-transporting ATPase subunit E